MIREKDFIKRAIEQLSVVFARVLKLKQQKQYEAALQALDGTLRDLIGVPRELVDRLDPVSAAKLIGDAEKIRVWAKILREEAGVRADMGEDVAPLKLRIVTMLLEALRRSQPRPEDLAMLSELKQEVDVSALEPGLQQRLRELVA